MIGIIDYGMGNLRSVQKALEHLHTEAKILQSPRELQDVEGIILPGVGAFRDSIAELKRHGFDQAIKDVVHQGTPFLGICLGLQLLFETSYEDGTYEGLGILKGDVVRFDPEPEIKIPHMGWNALKLQKESQLFEGISTGDYMYFVHSYYVRPTDDKIVASTTQHGQQSFVSAVAADNLYATQFHPEKSQRVGLQLLNNFAKLVSDQSMATTTE